MMAPSFLTEIPQEIIENIAFVLATDSLTGPPTELAHLVATSHHFYSRLSPAKNRNLYANIFAFKFDVGIATRRIGADRLTQSVLTEELQRRFILLKRIKARSESSVEQCDPTSTDGRRRMREILFGAYLLMIENEGKNEQHLRSCGMDGWLNEFWFRQKGTSQATAALMADRWPEQSEEHSLGMWLFWFLLKPDEYKSNRGSWNILYVLKIYALGAHRYHLATPPWTIFLPAARHDTQDSIKYYSYDYKLRPPSIASPAILSFLTILDILDASPTSSESRSTRDQDRKSELIGGRTWDTEWHRCVSLGRNFNQRVLSAAFTPGSIEGVWEGVFTYTEFSSYAELLGGAAPTILTKSMVVKHRQTWKLREHHLLPDEAVRASSKMHQSDEGDALLSAGDPLRSYFATGTRVMEDAGGVQVEEPGSRRPLRYTRPSSVHVDSGSVSDIILTGEGHSAWGQFSLVGRIRPCDGFISLSKDYIDGDRGKWLYRGYLIGNSEGNLSGRWRDTMSPIDTPGYEGCFTMSRRR